MAVGAVRVEGLRDLNRAFARLGAGVKKELVGELALAAEPVRAAAVELAVSGIRNIGPTWSQMRVGVTQSLVYVAPKARRRRGSPRRNLAPLLMDRAMQPALDENQAEVVGRLELMVDRLGGESGF